MYCARCDRDIEQTEIETYNGERYCAKCGHNLWESKEHMQRERRSARSAKRSRRNSKALRYLLSFLVAAVIWIPVFVLLSVFVLHQGRDPRASGTGGMSDWPMLLQFVAYVLFFGTLYRVQAHIGRWQERRRGGSSAGGSIS